MRSGHQHDSTRRVRQTAGSGKGLLRVRDPLAGQPGPLRQAEQLRSRARSGPGSCPGGQRLRRKLGEDGMPEYRLQLGQLTYLSFGRSDELENAVLAELLRTSFEMMQASEPKPPEDIRYKILDGYGTTGRGEHIEGLVPALPPDDHLAVHAWLREGLKYDGRPNLASRSGMVTNRSRRRPTTASSTVSSVRFLSDTFN